MNLLAPDQLLATLRAWYCLTHKLPLRLRAGVFLAGLVLLLPQTSLAQQSGNERSWSLGIALGAGERSNPLISSDDIGIHAVIDFSWYGEHWFFDNGDLGYTLFQTNNFSVNLLGTVNNERRFYSFLSGKQLGIDSIISKGLDFSTGLGSSIAASTDGTNAADTLKPTGTQQAPETFMPGTSLSPQEIAALNLDTALAGRDTAFNGGMELLYISRWGDLQAQVLTDVSNTHDGQEAWLSWSKPWFTRHGEYTLTMGLEWKSRELLGYYYGVTQAESFAARPAYEGSAGTNRYIRLAARHALSTHWQLVGMVEREYLSSAIRLSPIVNADTVDTYFTGLYYQF